MKIQIIIPIYKPDGKLIRLINMLKKQTGTFSLLIIDSGSDGLYRTLLNGLDAKVEKIDKKDFDHGGTRQWGIDIYPGYDIYIFLTQDAVPADDNTIKNIIEVFSDETVGCAFGRQLPYSETGFFGTHARLFNYPANSYKRSIKDAKKYGLKTVFISDSFAAYRAEALREAGGFPKKIILSEDMYVATKMLQADWQIAYVADAQVYHSHNYTIWQEFQRYFDIGVFHGTESWIRDIFGAAEGEGGRFVNSEIKYLLQHALYLLPEMIIRDGMKWLGYRMGIRYTSLSAKRCKAWSMNKGYWE